MLSRLGHGIALHNRQEIELPIAQTLEHVFVLLLHPLLSDRLRLVERIGRPLGRKDGPLDEEVRGKNRTSRSRVLSLDVKQPSSVTDVMVIAKERRTL
jgi:hypothetical protein